jgi:hypothetical protein
VLSSNPVLRREVVRTGIWWGNLKERGHLEYLGVDERVILKWIFKKRDGVKDSIGLAQDRGRWPVVANEVMNVWGL